MKNLFLFLFLNTIGMCYCQKFSLNEILNCIDQKENFVQNKLNEKKFEYVMNDTIAKTIVYKFSEIGNDIYKAQKIFQFDLNSEKQIYFVSYSSTDKEEYYNWIEYLESKNFQRNSAINKTESKEEWFFNDIFAVQIDTEKRNYSENKETINFYTIKTAKIPKD